LAFLGWANAFGQQVQSRTQKPGGSAEGTLTVTATVVSSSGLVIGPDGQLRVIVANAADPKDTPSHLPEAVVKPPESVSKQKPEAKPQAENPKQADFPQQLLLGLPIVP
jgi:hypothetical protein